MDENLQRLVSELRHEVCPKRVRDEVARRISSQPLQSRGFGYALPMTTAILLALCVLALWQWPQSQRKESRLPLAKPARLDHAQVVAQAEGALGYIGSALLSASARSEKAIYKEAVPPLRNGLQSTTDTILQLLKQ